MEVLELIDCKELTTKTAFKLGGIDFIAYSADESDGNGNPIYYMEVREVASAIGISKSDLDFLEFESLPLELALFLGEYKDEYGSFEDEEDVLTLWTIETVTKFWRYFDRKGNIIAAQICDSLIHANLSVVISDSLGLEYRKGGAEKLVEINMLSKPTYPSLKAEIEHYVSCYLDLDGSQVGLIYSWLNNLLFSAVMGKGAEELCEELKLEEPLLRIFIDPKARVLIEKVEELACKLIRSGDEPYQAMISALNAHKAEISEFQKRPAK
jgi:hypothetical protein